jgi:hypothetical protein
MPNPTRRQLLQYMCVFTTVSLYMTGCTGMFEVSSTHPDAFE